MTLDEAIKHCEEVAYQNEILMKRYDDASGYNRSHNKKIRTDGAKGCEQLISLYRQLAEWLKALKNYQRGIEKIKELKDGFNQIPLSLEASVLESALELLEEEGEPQNADKGVLEKINEKQDSLKATCKAWDKAISRDGYVN